MPEHNSGRWREPNQSQPPTTPRHFHRHSTPSPKEMSERLYSVANWIHCSVHSALFAAPPRPCPNCRPTMQDRVERRDHLEADGRLPVGDCRPRCNYQVEMRCCRQSLWHEDPPAQARALSSRTGALCPGSSAVLRLAARVSLLRLACWDLFCG